MARASADASRRTVGTIWLTITNVFVVAVIACLSWRFVTADRDAIATGEREIAGIRDLSTIVSRTSRPPSEPTARTYEAWFARAERAGLDVADRSGLTFDSDSDERDLADAYGRDVLRTSDVLTILDRVTLAVPGRTHDVARDVERLEIEAMAASDVADFDVHHASQSTRYRLTGLVSEGDGVQAALERLVARFNVRHRTLSQNETLHDRFHALELASRRFDTNVGTRLAAMLAHDDADAATHESLVWLISIGSIAMSFVLFNAAASANRTARAIERLEAERERDRRVADVQSNLLEAERLFRATVDHAPIGILIIDSNLSIVTANAEVTHLVGDVPAFIGSESANIRSVVDSGNSLSLNLTFAREDESVVHADVAYRRFSFGLMRTPYVIAILRDVSERHELTEMLQHEANHDALTALPNRNAFEAMLEIAKGRGEVALLYIDLDGFKRINDTYGHHTGDYVLAGTAERLRSVTRGTDVIGRVGGDEFAIGLCDTSEVDARGCADRVVAALSEPFLYEGRRLEISASVGFVPHCPAASDVDGCLRDADEAMYRAKALGGNRVLTFAAAMREATRRRLELAEDLRTALKSNQLTLVYQPIFDLRTRSVTGFEALSRWHHPTKGPISPTEFIPIGESIGVIEELGRHVLLDACRQLKTWREADYGGSHLTMNVNVAPQQILSGSIEKQLREALDLSGVPAGSVTVEITEGSLLDDVPQTMETLVALRRMGSRIYVDDFGTGYSSLSYLHRYPIDGIKVDRSFVSGEAHESLASRPIVEMLSTLSCVLGIDLVVEGIETARQCDELLELRCTKGQGYLLSRPLPPELIPALLTSGDTGLAAPRPTKKRLSTGNVA